MSPAPVSSASDVPGAYIPFFCPLFIDSNALLGPMGEGSNDEQMSTESRDREISPDFSPSVSPISRAASRGKFYHFFRTTV